MTGAVWAVGLTISLSFGSPAPSKLKFNGGFGAMSAPRMFQPAQQQTVLAQPLQLKPTMKAHK